MKRTGGQTPLTRSAAAFPSDYRRVLEASNLPVEVATAIADRLDKCGGPNDEGKHAVTDKMYRAGLNYIIGRGTAWCVTDLYLAMEDVRVVEGQSSATEESL